LKHAFHTRGARTRASSLSFKNAKKTPNESKMKLRTLIATAIIAVWSYPASAVEMLLLPITAASGPSVSQTFQIRPGPGGQWLPATATFQATFTYGSGGTSTDAYVQTSIDGGGTWVDVAQFHFLVASARFIWTLESSLIATPVQVTPTDGTMTSNTALSGVFGNMWRVKFVTTGTYAGGTTLRVDAIANGLTTLP
jgi:hypothetical protein